MNIERFKKELDRHRSANIAKFAFILERIKELERGFKDLQQETGNYYNFIGNSIHNLDQEVVALKNKVDK